MRSHRNRIQSIVSSRGIGLIMFAAVFATVSSTALSEDEVWYQWIYPVSPLDFGSYYETNYVDEEWEGEEWDGYPVKVEAWGDLWPSSLSVLHMMPAGSTGWSFNNVVLQSEVDGDVRKTVTYYDEEQEKWLVKQLYWNSWTSEPDLVLEGLVLYAPQQNDAERITLRPGRSDQTIRGKQIQLLPMENYDPTVHPDYQFNWRLEPYVWGHHEAGPHNLTIDAPQGTSMTFAGGMSFDNVTMSGSGTVQFDSNGSAGTWTTSEGLVEILDSAQLHVGNASFGALAVRSEGICQIGDTMAVHGEVTVEEGGYLSLSSLIGPGSLNTTTGMIIFQNTGSITGRLTGGGHLSIANGETFFAPSESGLAGVRVFNGKIRFSHDGYIACAGAIELVDGTLVIDTDCGTVATSSMVHGHGALEPGAHSTLELSNFEFADIVLTGPGLVRLTGGGTIGAISGSGALEISGDGDFILDQVVTAAYTGDLSGNGRLVIGDGAYAEILGSGALRTSGTLIQSGGTLRVAVQALNRWPVENNGRLELQGKAGQYIVTDLRTDDGVVVIVDGVVELGEWGLLPATLDIAAGATLKTNGKSLMVEQAYGTGSLDLCGADIQLASLGDQVRQISWQITNGGELSMPSGHVQFVGSVSQFDSINASGLSLQLSDGDRDASSISCISAEISTRQVNVSGNSVLIADSLNLRPIDAMTVNIDAASGSGGLASNAAGSTSTWGGVGELNVNLVGGYSYFAGNINIGDAAVVKEAGATNVVVSGGSLAVEGTLTVQGAAQTASLTLDGGDLYASTLSIGSDIGSQATVNVTATRPAGFKPTILQVNPTGLFSSGAGEVVFHEVTTYGQFNVDGTITVEDYYGFNNFQQYNNVTAGELIVGKTKTAEYNHHYGTLSAANVTLGAEADSDGTYRLYRGLLDISDGTIYVGEGGTGVLGMVGQVLNPDGTVLDEGGGTITADMIRFGAGGSFSASGTNNTLRINSIQNMPTNFELGGTLLVGHTGGSGAGSMSLVLSQQVTAEEIEIGHTADADISLTGPSARLTATKLSLGNADGVGGTIVQNGGTVQAGTLLNIGAVAGGAGSYSISAGTLEAREILIGHYGGSGSMTISGGTIIADYFNWHSGPVAITGTSTVLRANQIWGFADLEMAGKLQIGHAAGTAESFWFINADHALTVGELTVGYDAATTFDMAGNTTVGGVLYVGRYAGADGTINLSGGTLDATTILIGGGDNDGTGLLDITGGSMQTAAGYAVYVDSTNSTHPATLSVSGGTVASDEILIGVNQTGCYRQTDGTVTTPSFILGRYANSSGSAYLEGGTLNVATRTYIQYEGVGVFTQTGGQIDTPELWVFGGTYNMTGGMAVTSQLYMPGNSTLNMGAAAQITVNGDGKDSTSDVNMFTSASLNAEAGATIRLRNANLSTSSRSAGNMQGLSNLRLVCEYGENLLEICSEDRGAVMEGFENNFALGCLEIGDGVRTSYCTLKDMWGNVVDSSGDDVLYVDTLIINALGKLDLQGFTVYYLTLIQDDSGQVLDNSIWQNGQLIQVVPPPVFDSLVFDSLSGRKVSDIPFPVRLQALDQYGQPMTSVTATVNLTAVKGTESIIFADDFEDGECSDWSDGGMAYSTRAVSEKTAAAATRYSVELVGGNEERCNGIIREVAGVLPYRCRFHVRAGQMDKDAGCFVAGAGSAVSETVIDFMMRDDGTMGFYDGDGQWHGIPYAAENWYKIDVVLDWEMRTLNCHVNNQLAFENVSFRGSDATTLSHIYLFNLDYDPQAWWDEIELTEWSTTVTSVEPAQIELVAGVWQGDAQITDSGESFILQAEALTEDCVGLSTAFRVVPANCELSVSSVPVPAVAITGPHPGTTVYTVLEPLDEVISLSAPQSVDYDGFDWSFQRWVVDGVDQAPDAVNQTIDLDGNRQAIAVYQCITPDIRITGNEIEIITGDTAPEESDGTDFGATTVGGGSVVHTFAIENPGTADLTVTEISVDGDFSVSAVSQSLPAVIPVDGTMAFDITFAPATAGPHAATVSVASDDRDENPYTFAVAGIGGLYTVTFNLGEHGMYDGGGEQTQIVPYGGAAIAPSVEVDYGWVHVGWDLDFDDVTFDMTVLAQYEPGQPDIVVLGGDPAQAITNGDTTPDNADSTNFGYVDVDSASVTHTYTIVNAGTADLEINLIETGSDAFVLSGIALPATIGIGKERTFAITFDPAVGGMHLVRVSIEGNDPDEPLFTFAQQGRGAGIIPLGWTRILYNDGDICMMDVDGTDAVALTDTSGNPEGSNNNGKPIYCPDTDLIYFYSDWDEGWVGENLYSLELDGSDLQLLTPDDKAHADYCIHAPSQTIYFLTQVGDSKRIDNVALHGSKYESPAWGADKHPLDVNDAGTLLYTIDYQSLWTINSDGSNNMLVASDTKIAWVKATWSPDGLSIVATQVPDGGTCGLWLMDADGTNKTLVDIGNIEPSPGYPRFTPDGTKLLFAGREKGSIAWDIYVCNLDGTKPVNITNTPEISETDPYPFQPLCDTTTSLSVSSSQGIPSPSIGAHPYAPGTELTCTVTSPATEGTARQQCSGWIGTGSVPVAGTGTSTGPITLSEDSSIEWQWETEYRLDTDAGTGGSVDVADNWYTENTTVTVTATAAANYHFAGWAGDTADCTINGNQLTAVMTQARTIAAQFALNTYTVTFDPGEHGKRSGGGESIQTVAHGGSAIAPDITPEKHWTFAGWDTDFTNVVSAITVTAVYEPVLYTLTVKAVNFDDGWSIWWVPIDGSHPGDTEYTVELEYGTAVSLTAAAQYGDKHFRYWELDGAAQAAGERTLSFTISGATEVVAVYEYVAPTYTIDVSCSPVGASIVIGGTHPGTADYSFVVNESDQIELVAPFRTTIDGVQYGFVHWEVDGDVYGESERLYLDSYMDHSAVAVYEPGSGPDTIMLTVESVGVPEVDITGDYPGVTNYSVEVRVGAYIYLEAPMRTMHDGKVYVFQDWEVNGEAQNDYIPYFSQEVYESMTVTAKYAGGNIYVDDTAYGNNDGSCWHSAFTDLQDAFDVAPPGATIQIAAGTYKPSSWPNGGADDRDRHFSLINGVTVLGGYPDAGGERNPALNPTILSGDIDSDGIVNDGNCRHVFYHPAGLLLDESAILDGVTITGGFGDEGSAIHNFQCSPTFRNCVITDNESTSLAAFYSYDCAPIISDCTFTDNRGGAVCNYVNAVSVFTDCRFAGNSATNGGAVQNIGASPTFTGCSFMKNSASGSGGAISESGDSSSSVINCVFIGNTAQNGGALNYSDPSLATSVVNCTIVGNTATAEGGGITVLPDYRTLTMWNCILWANTAPVGSQVGPRGLHPVTINNSCVEGGYPGQNIALDPLLVDADGPDDLYGTPDDDLHLLLASPCVNAGSATGAPATDIEATGRVGLPDMGAYESLGNHPPRADAGGPYIITQGDALRLDGSGSYDPDEVTGDLISYGWDLNNDGSYADNEDESPEISWSELTAILGTELAYLTSLPVTLRIADQAGLFQTAQTSLFIYKSKPIAAFTTAPTQAAPGETISFDATGSYHPDPQRTIVEYSWDLNNDGTPDASGTTAQFAYGSFGQFNAVLTVTDDVGNSASISRTINVTQGNRAPIADVGGPYITSIGDHLRLDASGSFDPDEIYGDFIASVVWDIDGDGVFSDASGYDPQLQWNQLELLLETPAQYPADPFTHLPKILVSVKITDGFGVSTTDTTTLTVYRAEPVADFTFTPTSPYVNEAVTFDASNSYHGHPAYMLLSFEWDFSYNEMEGFTAEGTGYSIEHTWTTADDFTVALRVTDDLNKMDITSKQVTVTERQATVNITAPANSAVFYAPAIIPLEAEVIAAEGVVERVVFYDSTNHSDIATVTSAPYETTWSYVPAGTYTVNATVHTLTGQAVTSPSITVQVQEYGPPVWQVDILLTGADKESISLGMHEQATDSFDLGLDDNASPTTPGDSGSTYFLKDAFLYSRDLRGPSESAEWDLWIESGTVDMILNWTVSGLSESEYLLMEELDGNNDPVPETLINMKDIQEMTVAVNQIKHFRLIYVACREHELTLVPGWNLFSVPLEPLFPFVADIFADQDLVPTARTTYRDSVRGTLYTGKVWQWIQDGATGQQKYEEALNIKPLRGYWLYLENSCDPVLIEGTAVRENLDFNLFEDPEEGSIFTILCKGWNLYGPVSPVTGPYNKDILGSIWWWDRESRVYKTVPYTDGVLFPGRGYWIFSSGDNVPFNLGQDQTR